MGRRPSAETGAAPPAILPPLRKPPPAVFPRAVLLSIALIFSCAGGNSAAGNSDAENGDAGHGVDVMGAAEAGAEQEPAPVIPHARGALFPDTLRPGEPFTVILALPEHTAGLSAVLISPRGRRLGRAAFFPLEQASSAAPPEGAPPGAALQAALLAVPSLAATGTGRVIIEGFTDDGDAPEFFTEGLPLVILGREFQAETIELDRRNTAIRTDTSPRRNTEVDELWAILNHTGTALYAGGAFVPPVTSTRRTSHFGDRRVFRYVSGDEDTSVHAGIDYGVPRGTPVSAAARGRVVLARERVVTGHSVIIEHFPGVYSLYYHLDSIALTEGSMVEAGALLGTSGATGLATGPHLHWEIRVAGENADPDAFTARPLLDREAIYALLSAEHGRPER
ncbi:MAG: M23 family metallopeptidase [Spirochaetaceae bacterium]|jgi:hypothetical protein|nr:M23 family metallopeptidase [Spirochaetaceae bacterium]